MVARGIAGRLYAKGQRGGWASSRADRGSRSTSRTRSQPRREPTTRAPPRRPARRRAARSPADALGLVLYQLPLAHDIAAVAPTCHQLATLRSSPSGAAQPADTRRARRRAERMTQPDGRIITGFTESAARRACVRTIQAHTMWVKVMAAQRARLVSGDVTPRSCGPGKLAHLCGGQRRALRHMFARRRALCGRSSSNGLNVRRPRSTQLHTPGHQLREPQVTTAITSSATRLSSRCGAAKSLVSNCTETSFVEAVVARCPRAASSRRDGRTVRVWLLKAPSHLRGLRR